jgi:hypothetical protein
MHAHGESSIVWFQISCRFSAAFHKEVTTFTIFAQRPFDFSIAGSREMRDIQITASVNVTLPVIAKAGSAAGGSKLTFSKHQS